jgi:hypothetical protein
MWCAGRMAVTLQLHCWPCFCITHCTGQSTRLTTAAPQHPQGARRHRTPTQPTIQTVWPPTGSGPRHAAAADLIQGYLLMKHCCAARWIVLPHRLPAPCQLPRSARTHSQHRRNRMPLDGMLGGSDSLWRTPLNHPASMQVSPSGVQYSLKQARTAGHQPPSSCLADWVHLGPQTSIRCASCCRCLCAPTEVPHAG